MEPQQQPDQQASNQEASAAAAAAAATMSCCSLLQKLSQDLLDRGPVELNTGGCDSSDCFFCQGQRQFCNQSLTQTACSWLGPQRRPSAGAPAPPPPAAAASQGECPCPAPPPCAVSSTSSTPETHLQPAQLLRAHAADEDEQQHPKRLRPSPELSRASSATTGADVVHAAAAAAVAAAAAAQHQLQQPLQEDEAVQQPAVLTSASLLRECWQWQPEFGAFEQPAPARFVPVARLQSAADSAPGTCVGRCDRVSGLEFSTDGQLLAAAGVSKQVTMYSLSALSDAEWTAAACAGDSSAASQRQRRRQQQQEEELPLLPAVATVRLPGKVSSFAFSPDMQGVISIGDYDGTLTQVHVASGHYLSEVDAHAGRRIWSVCHSKLRRHLAVTASDDCSAKLWAGSGLACHAGTIVPPGRPAVCGADFCSSSDTLLCLAAADARVYLYDLRALAEPLAVLHGHQRPVSYAKFFGAQRLVSASIDGTLAVWDLGPVLGVQQQSAAHCPPGTGAASSSSSDAAAAAAAAASEQQQTQTQTQPRGSSRLRQGSCGTADAGGAAAPASSAHHHQPWKVFRGHANEKNFVGLSVDPGAGLMAVGSETSEVFTYHTSWHDPLAKFDMAQQQQQPHQQSALLQQLQQPAAATWTAAPQSVSAVAWQPSCRSAAGSVSIPGRCASAAALLAAATSGGECRLLGLVRP